MLLIIETITWKPHVETAMEIALRRREAGQEVVYCNLRRGLPACEDRAGIHRLIDLPETRVRRASALLEREGIRVLRPDYTRAQLRAAAIEAARLVAGCRDDEDLRRLSHAGYSDLGWGVISSVVSVTQDPTGTLASHRKSIERYCAAGILVHDKVLQLIAELKPTELLLFNGRFATTRAALRAAQAAGVPWLMHERGGDRNRFRLSDCLPHDKDRIQQHMLEDFRPEHAEAGHAFFAARRNRVERDWHSFTHGQERGRLPEAMAAPGDWVSFFTTSEDEVFAIGDVFLSDRYPDQMDAVEKVAEAARELGMRLCVRVHPHVASKSRAERQKWEQLDLPGVIVLGPEDATDSYALIERSKVVCTYGSTVGIEATYWGRPSLLFAPAFYDRIGVCELAGDAAHVREFLRAPRQFPREATLPYGAFYERLGEPYRFYKAEGLHRGSICGVYLDDSVPMRAARSLLEPARRLLGRGH